MAKIIATVTNDLTYDQRMQRICTTLVQHGHEVTLLGRQLADSKPFVHQVFKQKRLNCFFNKGMLFYAEYNIRVFIYLLFARYDAVCSVDLDSLPAGCFATLLRRKKRVFDAHEYFTEVPELSNRPIIRAVWGAIGRFCLLFYRHAYTVGGRLAHIFTEKYSVSFAVVRNVPFRKNPAALPYPIAPTAPLILLYQGALNAARGIEQALEAMQYLEGVELHLAGEGDLSSALREQAHALGLEGKVRFLGYIAPADLKALTAKAWLGLNLLENRGLSYYYSLANKFFDYAQAGVPCLTMDFPEYRRLVESHETAILLPDLAPESIVNAVNALKNEPERYLLMQKACLAAGEEWTWERESIVLMRVWDAVFTQPNVPATS